MDHLVDLHSRAADAFGRRVESVADRQWHAPTPCADWDVRMLVNHLVYECRWAVPLFGGATVAEVGDQFEGDLLGDDPVATWRRAVGDAQVVIADPGALERTVHLSWTDAPGSEYLTQLVLDLAVHGWDLARAIGADETIDPGLVELSLGWVEENEGLVRAAGAFGEQLEVPDGASPQTRLLAALGRRAG